MAEQVVGSAFEQNGEGQSPMTDSLFDSVLYVSCAIFLCYYAGFMLFYMISLAYGYVVS